MRTWEDIKELVGHYPKSISYKVPHNEDKNEYYDTINETFGNDCEVSVDDSVILNSLYDLIKETIKRHSGRDVYVRIYPEISIRQDGSKKNVYCRLQFVDKTKIEVGIS